MCSYRCIVSYESKLLEDFSLCILQKHNVMGMSASIPTRPHVDPMTTFQVGLRVPPHPCPHSSGAGGAVRRQ